MNSLSLLLIFGTALLLHCLYLLVVLRMLSDKLTNKLLSAILILFALRTGKSTVSLLVPESDHFTAIVGLVTMAGLGPLLLLYIDRTFRNDSPIQWREYLFFIPALANLYLLISFSWSAASLLYYFFTAHLLFYCVVATVRLWKNKSVYATDDLQWQWNWQVVVGYFILCASFIVQLLFYDKAIYTMNVFIAALVVYGLSILALRKSKFFIQSPKKRQIDTHDYHELGIRIQSLLEEEEIFCDADLTVTKLAARLKMPPYLISKIINQFFTTTFPELVLKYRLRKAEQLLQTKSEVLSIEGIAYESGFNSLSVFYSSFKKVHKMTPAQYRREFGSKGGNMKIA